ncbi:hypothetical protein DXA21_21255 [Parabacteroides distasonis]|nr:hypothetical protein DXA21_21255 [Parabacteroides distasonis]
MSNILRICISNRQKIFYDIHQELFNEADPKVKFHKGELTNSNLTVLILLLKALSYHQKKKSDKALLCIGLTIRSLSENVIYFYVTLIYFLYIKINLTYYR